MNNKIIRQVSKELSIDMDTVDFVQRSMWKYVRLLMEEKKFRGLMLPYFGKFIVKDANKEKAIKSGWAFKAKNDYRHRSRMVKLDSEAGESRNSSRTEIEDMSEMSL